MFTYILFFIGFVFLIKGADLLVDGASSIAKKFRVSDIVIGLTIVSFGTSAPELVVNLMASFGGNNDIAIGNILGSNISNTLFILGVAALIKPLTVKRNTTWKEIPLSLLSVVALAVMVNDALIDGRVFSALTRIDGFVLLMFFAIFLYYTFGISKVSGEENEDIKKYSSWMSLGMITLGMIGLALGGQWIVNGAVEIARSFGMSEALIGLTIIAIGTSLPELAASAMAAYRGSADIAIGNVVGSNIFNVLWILGISSTIKTLNFSSALNFDVMVVVGVTFLLFLFMFVGRKHTLERWQAVGFLFMYAAYISYLVVRG